MCWFDIKSSFRKITSSETMQNDKTRKAEGLGGGGMSMTGLEAQEGKWLRSATLRKQGKPSGNFFHSRNIKILSLGRIWHPKALSHFQGEQSEGNYVVRAWAGAGAWAVICTESSPPRGTHIELPDPLSDITESILNLCSLLCKVMKVTLVSQHCSDALNKI